MDVVKSGRRDDQLLLRMRADLRAMVADALAHTGLADAAVHIEDLGDGLRLIVSADVTPTLMLDPFVPRLTAALREHRKAAAEAARLRLRVAVHMGLLHRQFGFAGQPLVHCARLLDATPLRRVFDTSARVDLAVIVSQDVYDKVVRHGYGLDPAAYRRITVREKETETYAWVHTPGFAVPPGLDSQTDDAGPARTLSATEPARFSSGPWAPWTRRHPATPRSVRANHLGRIAGIFLTLFGVVGLAGAVSTWLHRPVPAPAVTAAAAVCLACTVVLARPRSQVARRFLSPSTTVTIRVGDLFEQDTHIVAGFTDTFDTLTADDRVINSTAVQGQLVDRRYGGDRRRLDRELQAGLARYSPIHNETRETKRWGKLSRFPIGTVAVLGKPGQHIFAVAYGRMGNDLVTRSSVDDLWLSLSRLWDAVYENGERLPVAMPIVGSGLARIDNLNPLGLAKLIVLSFIAHSHPSLLTRELRLIVRPADVGRLDLQNLATFLRDL
jgi:hypothetical protein